MKKNGLAPVLLGAFLIFAFFISAGPASAKEEASVTLDLATNQISDLWPLSNLYALGSLYFYENQIEDLGPLVNNPGVGAGDRADGRCDGG